MFKWLRRNGFACGMYLGEIKGRGQHPNDNYQDGYDKGFAEAREALLQPQKEQVAYDAGFALGKYEGEHLSSSRFEQEKTKYREAMREELFVLAKVARDFLEQVYVRVQDEEQEDALRAVLSEYLSLEPKVLL